MMRQYRAAKSKAGDALLFFRMGDFYEMFFDDAKVASRALGLTLTSRDRDRAKGEPVPMAGVPVRAVDGYLRRLVTQGFRVAICEQLQDPASTKGIVDRDVVRVVTPGTLTEDSVLEEKSANYLLALAPTPKRAGLAWADLSTGRFFVEDVAREDMLDAVARVGPSEILLPEACIESEADLVTTLGRVRGAPAGAVRPVPDWICAESTAARTVKEHFKVATGKYNDMLDDKIAEIKSTCGL